MLNQCQVYSPSIISLKQYPIDASSVANSWQFFQDSRSNAHKLQQMFVLHSPAKNEAASPENTSAAERQRTKLCLMSILEIEFTHDMQFTVSGDEARSMHLHGFQSCKKLICIETAGQSLSNPQKKTLSDLFEGS